MTTNRGRVFEIGTACDGVRMQPLHIAKGTAITGLYASHVSSTNSKRNVKIDANQNRTWNTVLSV